MANVVLLDMLRWSAVHTIECIAMRAFQRTEHCSIAIVTDCFLIVSEQFVSSRSRTVLASQSLKVSRLTQQLFVTTYAQGKATLNIIDDCKLFPTFGAVSLLFRLCKYMFFMAFIIAMNTNLLTSQAIFGATLLTHPIYTGRTLTVAADILFSNWQKIE